MIMFFFINIVVFIIFEFECGIYNNCYIVLVSYYNKVFLCYIKYVE